MATFEFFEIEEGESAFMDKFGFSDPVCPTPTPSSTTTSFIATVPTPAPNATTLSFQQQQQQQQQQQLFPNTAASSSEAALSVDDNIVPDPTVEYYQEPQESFYQQQALLLLHQLHNQSSFPPLHLPTAYPSFPLPTLQQPQEQFYMPPSSPQNVPSQPQPPLIHTAPQHQSPLSVSPATAATAVSTAQHPSSPPWATQGPQYATDLQPPPSPEAPDETIVKVAEGVKEQETFILQIGELQRCFLINPSEEAFKNLVNQQINLKNALESEIKKLEHLKSEKLLSPTNIISANILLNRIALQRKQLELYETEMMASLELKPNNCCAVLVIEDEPFPNVYLKEKKGISRPIKLSLLKSSTLQIAGISPINVTCLFKCPQVRNSRAVDIDRVAIDPVKGGQYSCQFLTGSRLETANLRFDATLYGQQQNVASSSPSSSSSTPVSNGCGPAAIKVGEAISRPFIVITNEKQFEEAMKRLFISEVFQAHNSERLPWPTVANALAIYFLKATRQDLSRPTRGLSEKDFLYLHKRKFSDSKVITIPLFERFWDSWFGVVLHELRYKRYLRQMWNLGLIYGFVDKEYVTLYLHRQNQSGCCLLRFSETKPGSIAVNAMSTQRERVSNYLIKAEETSSKKTHADFLREKRQFTHVLQFMNCYTPDGIPQLRAVEKDLILRQFYTQQQQREDEEGSNYDSWDDDDDVTQSNNNNNCINGNFNMDAFFASILPSKKV